MQHLWLSYVRNPPQGRKTAFVKKNTSLHFISACSGGVHIDNYVRSYFFDGQKIGDYTQSEEYLKFYEQKMEHYLYSNSCVLIGEDGKR